MAGAATGQNGIDILCDAAGSDLVSSLLSLAYPGADEGQAQKQQQQRPQLVEQSSRSHPAAGGIRLNSLPTSPGQPVVKRPPKRRRSQTTSAPTPATTSGPQHVCHICSRVYERADHLTRHLRAHENARSYACTRCPKRFNRADLLTRHEATHDREGNGSAEWGTGIGGQRSLIRRGDRAAEACTNCAASKAKCEDEKPCSRCRNKGLACEVPVKRTPQFRTSIVVGPVGGSAVAGSAGPENLLLSSEASIPVGVAHSGLVQTHGDGYVDDGSVVGGGRLESHVDEQSLLQEGDMGHQVVMAQGMMTDDAAYFNPVQTFFQDMDFSTWDINFDGLSVPQYEPLGGSPLALAPLPPNATSTFLRTLSNMDPAKGHEAFKRSPWLWDPEPTRDYARQSKEGLNFKDDSIVRPLTYERLSKLYNDKLKMNAATRDKVFAMVLSQIRGSGKVTSFPSLQLLNYLLLVNFMQDEYKIDSWIHAASFDSMSAMPLLLCAIISHGAAFIIVPAIWQFGLAMNEVVRIGIANSFEAANKNTRNLPVLQAYMLQLDVGIWSGFKRMMEIAEGFLQPLLTMMRRAGHFSLPPEQASLAPLATDSKDLLETKWHGFAERESYKRLCLHLFLHGVQSSIALCTRPIIALPEMCFSLPASRDLFRARTAEQWREIYLSKKPLPLDATIPRMSDVLHNRAVLDDLADRIDVELCYATMLHGFWPQISSYQESAKFFSSPHRSAQHQAHVFLQIQHQELYRNIETISTQIMTSRAPSPHLAVVSELFAVILHVTLDDLQLFAGKNGEEEARRIRAALESLWAGTADARHAAWHAGQVLRHARRLPPTSLREFNAIAVYYSSLALWIYGILHGDREAMRREGSTAGYVLLDGEETRETRAFVQLDSGVPALSMSAPNGGGNTEIVPLADSETVLGLAQEVFRVNFPVRSEPLPPLVESLSCLLRDLGIGNSETESPAMTTMKD